MLKKVKNPFHNRFLGNSSPYVHRIFVEMSGRPTNDKKALINQALVDWQVALRKKKEVADEEKECPFYQPSTQNLELRTFFGVMKDHYNFHYVLKDFNKFQGSLGGVLSKLYQARVQKYVSFREEK